MQPAVSAPRHAQRAVHSNMNGLESQWIGGTFLGFGLIVQPGELVVGRQ